MKSLIDEFNEKMKSYLPGINKETNELIKKIQRIQPIYLSKTNSNKKDDKEYIDKINKEIEYQLDFLMNPYIEKQFYNVLAHWKKLNPKSAQDYDKIYKEIFE